MNLLVMSGKYQEFSIMSYLEIFDILCSTVLLRENVTKAMACNMNIITILTC